MSKTSIAGVIVCLLLMAVFFFFAGFVSGLRSGAGHPAAVQGLAAPGQPQRLATGPEEPLRSSSAQPSVRPMVRHMEQVERSMNAARAGVAQQRTGAEAAVQPVRTLVPSFQRMAHTSRSTGGAPAAQGGQGYLLKAGFYPTLPEAEQAAVHVHDAGYVSSVMRESVQGRPEGVQAGYSVSAGLFHDQALAHEALDVLKQRGFVYAVLVPVQGSVS